jgi:hypothetical protein
MSYLQSVIKQFEYYKMLGEKTFAQVSEEKLFWQYNEESNSIAVIVKHLWGNMLSRWTDFLHTDGEKEWRNRDAEFENDINTKEELLGKWNEGWKVFMDTLHSLTEEDLDKTIYIRNQGHTVMEAINRQLAHYPYHVGQIVFIGKMCVDQWNSLSIPRGSSKEFNAEKFSKPKQKAHFTDEFLNPKTGTDDIKQQLRTAHQALWDECAALPQELQTKSENGKWSAVQHVQHITKGAGAFYKYLKTDKPAIEQAFGVTDKGSRSYDELFALYKQKLSDGTAVSTQPFSPEDSQSISLQTEREKGTHIIEGMISMLGNWNEADLDRYLCPHPALGKLTAREMLYFTTFHAEHHTNSVRKIKSALTQ